MLDEIVLWEALPTHKSNEAKVLTEPEIVHYWLDANYLGMVEKKLLEKNTSLMIDDYFKLM